MNQTRHCLKLRDTITVGKTCSAHGGLATYLNDEMNYKILNLYEQSNIMGRSIYRSQPNLHQASCSKYKNDIKGTWSMTKEVFNKTQNTPDYPDSFKLDGCVIADQIQWIISLIHIFPVLAQN